MGTKEKLIERFRAVPSDFSYLELERLLATFGYSPYSKGKTSGSRIIFKNKDRIPIMLHKPHPGNIIKQYVLKQILQVLKQEGLL